MKQYLLSLRSSDFIKSGNTWTSSSINLYNNTSYKNYSLIRSPHGIDLVGDRTFTGLEVSSPSFSGTEPTAIDQRAIYVTDYGEVVYEEATPSLLRFIDTSSQIDLLSFKHTFTGVQGSSNPTFSLVVYESDEENGPWLKNFSSGDIGTLFIRNCKPYIKLELEIEDDGTDLSTIGLVFYLEVGIHDLVPPVSSKRAKNILKRFPSWTKIFEDSLDSATPSLDVPQSEGGKFISALIQDNLGRFENIVDLNFINSFINTADINQLDWIYRSYSIPPAVTSVLGDGVNLSRVSSLETLLSLRSTDYAYVLDPINKTITTLRKFDNLVVNSITREQEPINVFNDFDEMGARIALPRLYLESNSNFRLRILDYAKNPPSSNVSGLKRTLRRELDIWRAYGSTPDSSYVGATPEILEISDIETSTPYVDSYGRPTEKFRTLVKNLNKTYPSNIGYIRWGNGVWDYAGILGEGVSRLPAAYDQHSSPLGQYYKPGVGDFSDAKIEIANNYTYDFNSSETVNFLGRIDVTGKEASSTAQSYEPIAVDYLFYMSYIVNEIQQQSEGVVFTYEIDIPEHDNYATPSTFYANFHFDDDENLFVKNIYPETSSTSPEYIQYNVFDQDNLVFDYISFKDKVYNSEYLNTETTPNLSRININNASQVRVVFGKTWNANTQSYVTQSYGDHRIAFAQANPNFYSSSAFNAGDTMSISAPSINAYNANLYLGSEYYGATPVLYNTPVKSRRIYLNNDNVLTSASSPSIIDIDLLKNEYLIPASAIPQYIYLNTSENLPYTGVDGSIFTNEPAGYFISHIDGEYYSVPASPNMVYEITDASNNTVQSGGYFSSATVNYDSSEKYIKVQSVDGDLYPLEYDVYSSFSYSSDPHLISGFIDEYGNAYSQDEEPINAYYKNDKYVDDFAISKETFGLSSNDFVIENISLVSATPGVKLYTDHSKEKIQEISAELSSGNIYSLPVYADNEESYTVAINSGYIYYDEDEWYIYINDHTQNENGSHFSLELDYTPNVSAPVIVTVDGAELRNLAFEDQSTPGAAVFSNTESVQYMSDNKLNLSYTDLSLITVVDSYTGRHVATMASDDDGIIEVFNEATPGIVGRFYDVSYTVNNSFYVDPDVYDGEEYSSYIYFSSTPNSNVDYAILYETSLNKNIKNVELEIDQYENPLNEGFIYLSNEDYNFSHVKTSISPTFMFDDHNDFINLVIISYDENNNLKPGQTFRVYGSNVTANPEYITTNENGMGVSKVYYSGPIPTILSSDIVYIDGIGSATPNGSLNSSSEGYSAAVSFEMMTQTFFKLSVDAVPLRYSIKADGLTDIICVGQVKWNGYPVQFPVDISWKLADSVNELFTSPDQTGVITSGVDGKFTFSNTVTANDRSNPGIRYIMFEIDSPSTVVSNLQALGEVIEGNDVTISGDIVYWDESYDNIHYDDEEVVMSRVFTKVRDENHLLYTRPNFIYRYSNPDVIGVVASAPNLATERWVAIPRYDQYQMGILGSTPNLVEDYSAIHPDHGDM